MTNLFELVWDLSKTAGPGVRAGVLANEFIGIGVLLGALCFPSANASGKADAAQVSVAGGIAAPSSSTAVFQNAAGLTEVAHTAIDVSAGFPDSSLKHGTYGLGFLYGKQGFGMAAGAEYEPNHSASAAYYGLAVAAQSLNVSLGVAGHTPISPSGDSSFNLGLHFRPGQMVGFGFTAMGVSGNPDEYGIGLVYAASSEVDLVVDSTVNEDFAHPVLAPGVRVSSGQASLTISYGLKPSSTYSFSSEQIREGFMLGGGVKLSSSVQLQAYYNQLNKYYATMSIEL